MFLVGLSLIGVAGSFIYESYKNRPLIQTAMWDLELGMNENDVLFLKGAPSKIEEKEGSDEWWSVRFYYDNEYNDWSYSVFFSRIIKLLEFHISVTVMTPQE